MLIVQFVFATNVLLVDFEYLKPKFLSLSRHVLDVGAHQRLLQDFAFEDLVEVLVEAKDIAKNTVLVDEFDGDTQNLRDVIEAEFLQAAAPLGKGEGDHLLRSEHAACVFLVGL